MNNGQGMSNLTQPYAKNSRKSSQTDPRPEETKAQSPDTTLSNRRKTRIGHFSRRKSQDTKRNSAQEIEQPRGTDRTKRGENQTSSQRTIQQTTHAVMEPRGRREPPQRQHRQTKKVKQAGTTSERKLHPRTRDLDTKTSGAGLRWIMRQNGKRASMQISPILRLPKTLPGIVEHTEEAGRVC